jgi:uncharacterized protein
MFETTPILKQRWRYPLFLHWSVDQEQLRPHVPEGMTIETHGGKAWIGIIAVKMEGTRLPGMPRIPRLTDSLSLNIRTYVRVNGVPGVYFFSLDANNAAAPIASKLVGVDYQLAKMSLEDDGDRVRFTSRRDDHAFDITYRPGGLMVATSLERFIAERYATFSVLRKKILRLRIDHSPWSLMPVRIFNFSSNVLASLELPGSGEPLAFAGDPKDVDFFLPENAHSPIDTRWRPWPARILM